MTTNQVQANLILSYNREAEQRNKGVFEDWKATERAEFLALLKNEQKQFLLEIGAGHGRDSLFFQENGVVDPKNWRLPVGVEFTRKEVYDVQDAQEFQCGNQGTGGAGIDRRQKELAGSQSRI